MEAYPNQGNFDNTDSSPTRQAASSTWSPSDPWSSSPPVLKACVTEDKSNNHSPSAYSSIESGDSSGSLNPLAYRTYTSRFSHLQESGPLKNSIVEREAARILSSIRRGKLSTESISASDCFSSSQSKALTSKRLPRPSSTPSVSSCTHYEVPSSQVLLQSVWDTSKEYNSDTTIESQMSGFAHIEPVERIFRVGALDQNDEAQEEHGQAPWQYTSTEDERGQLVQRSNTRSTAARPRQAKQPGWLDTLSKEVDRKSDIAVGFKNGMPTIDAPRDDWDRYLYLKVQYFKIKEVARNRHWPILEAGLEFQRQMSRGVIPGYEALQNKNELRSISPRKRLVAKNLSSRSDVVSDKSGKDKERESYMTREDTTPATNPRGSSIASRKPGVLANDKTILQAPTRKKRRGNGLESDLGPGWEAHVDKNGGRPKRKVYKGL